MKTVLLIDDNTVLLSALSLLVEKNGCRAIAAPSGQEGLKVLDECLPDLILLDIIMEPMDGWETLRRIRAQEATRHVPVIMLTAKTLFPGDVLEYGLKIHGYIRKPLRYQELELMLTSFWEEQDTIERILTRAADAGAPAKSILEYTDLRRQIRVIMSQMHHLERLTTVAAQEQGIRELFHREFAEIHDWLSEHCARYLVLEGEVEEPGIISCL